jgi:glycosyltransferase involved in cell wall biosynthesis
MRILLINSEYPPIGGGAGNASANIARGLAALGHQVTVLTAHFGDQPMREQKDGVTVQRIPALRRKPDRSDALEQLAFIAAAAFRIPGLVRETNPETSLAFFGVPSGAIAWLLKRRYGIPYIVSLRGGDVPGFRPYDFRIYHKLIAPALRVIWRDAAAVIANSNGLRDLARAFNSREIPVIPNGVDPLRNSTGARAWTPVRLLSVGRVVHQKGLDLGLRALAGLQDLDWEWYIVGDGTQMRALKSLARELGLSDRVRFPGWQSREELAGWYHQANLFIFPSRHEGMPNAVLEAMASGLPVIATRIAGNEELVLDGLTGTLVEPEDVESLRAGLHKLLTDAQMREQMGAAGRRRVEQEYSWETVARQYETVLQRSLQEAAKENLNH